MMIPRRKKYCKGCQTEQYLFGRGLCQSCYQRQMRRTPIDRPNTPHKPLSRKSNGKIPPRKKKSSVTDLWLQQHWGFKSQVEMFDELWDASPHMCFFTKENLSSFKEGALRHNCCAHILPKGNYPLFKLNIENVRLVHPEFHRIVDQGTVEDRALHPTWKFDVWDKMVVRMKKKYDIFKKEHLL